VSVLPDGEIVTFVPPDRVTIPSRLLMEFTTPRGEKYPLTSNIRSIVPGPSTWTVMAPAVPSGTMAALESARIFGSQFRVATVGFRPFVG
jgi:hypothetical protein